MTAFDGGTLVRRHARVAHANAQRSWTEREGVVLELRAGGLVGHGEAAPLPGYSRDDLETAIGELSEVWTRLPLLRVEHDVRETFREAARASGVRSAAATFALETALLDLVAQARSRPAWAVLRGNDEARPVPISALGEGGTPGELAASAERARARGLTVVKVKVGAGGTLARDLERLAAVRTAVGDALGLRLDANQALAADGLADALASLVPFAPELVEEPCSALGLDDLPGSPVPLALDESLMARDAEARIRELGRRGLLSAVVLKPMALGGLDRCLLLAEAAASVGVGALVTHMFDGPVAWAGAACLALALPGLGGKVLPCGMDAHATGGPLAPRDRARVLALASETHIVPFLERGLGIVGTG